MQTQASSYVIVREDLEVDPLVVLTDGLRIGRHPSSDLHLNHPAVSRLHAGLREQGGDFYLYNFSHSTRTTLNGRVMQAEAAEVVADGDLLHVGPFFLRFERAGSALLVRVFLRMAGTDAPDDPVSAEDATRPYGEGVEVVADEVAATPAAAAPRAAVAPEVSSALSVFWSARRREEGKIQRLSPLRPHRPARVLGKSRFNWTPTRDLVRPWPWSVFVWGAVVVGALSVVAAYAYTQAFSPAPLSAAHARPALSVSPAPLSAAHARPALNVSPAVARGPNANSCTTCHGVSRTVEQSCASCHTTEAFDPATIRQHAEAGVGCNDCHTEHRGDAFSPSAHALRSCAECHSDANRRAYNGRRVGTPHGGTFGYPVEGGRWVWEGLGEAAWAAKPAELRRALERWPAPNEDARRSAQFHALHLHRVRAVAGLAANEAGEVSCSTCHAAFAPAVDRETPRTTCAACHSGDVDGRFNPPLQPAGAPNCTSCHVQHAKGRRLWGASLVSAHEGSASAR